VRSRKITLILTMMAFMFSGVGYAAVKKVKAKSKLHQKRLKINPITDYESAWIANIETDVYQAGTFENITVGYSANDGWDISLSLLNTQMLGNNNQFQGNTFVNIAKTFDINNDFSITAGTQNGVALANVQPQLWFNFNFLDNRYDVTPWLLLHGGLYLANAAITGTSRQVGFLTGTEITFIQNKLSLQMDYISGHHSLSGATVNMLFNITPRCQIYMGVLVPEQNSGNEFAGIIGFNLSTHNL
jgi:hypothetical protein